MGGKAEHVFKTIAFLKKENENDFDTVLANFKDHFILKTNVTYGMAKFHLRAHHPGETVTTFARALYELAEDATLLMQTKNSRTVLKMGSSTMV